MTGLAAIMVTMRVAEPDRREEAARIVGEILGGTVTLGAEPTSLDAQVPRGREDVVPDVLPSLRSAGIVVPEFSVGQPSLDEVFLALTGEPADDADAEAAPLEGQPVETGESR